MWVDADNEELEEEEWGELECGSWRVVFISLGKLGHDLRKGVWMMAKRTPRST